jgi:hypothetical protein
MTKADRVDRMSAREYMERQRGVRVRSKYGSRPDVVDGFRFDSQLEARRYRQLLLLKQAGQIKYILRQVPFWLAEGVTYRLDFLIEWLQPNQGTTFEDVKGVLTQTSRTKIRLVEQQYGIQIRLLNKSDIGRG